KCNRHGMTTIAQGSASCLIEGQPVALHGHRCECGCTLVSSFPDYQVAS
ncbi:PAAR domain-containing protein, partial [Photorhabdus sp. RM157S]